MPSTPESEAVDPGERPGVGAWPVYALAFVLAACSLLYQLLAAQTFSQLAANTVIWFSLVVGVFLASMGFGAIRSAGVGRGDEWRALFRVEVALTLSGALAVPALKLGHVAFMHLEAGGHLGASLLLFYGVGLAVVCTVGTLTGVELPLLMRIARGIRDEPRSANLTLGFDYIGSLAGALIFPLVLVPSMGLVEAGLSVAAVNAVMASWVLGRRLAPDVRAAEVLVMVGCTVGLSLAVLRVQGIDQYFLQRFHYTEQFKGGWLQRFAPRPDLPRVVHARSPYQTLTLVETIQPEFMWALHPAWSTKQAEEPDFPVNYQLFLNGDLQFDMRFEEVYHEWFAHVPIAAAGRVPERVLVLGGGDGLLIRELCKYPEVQHIRHVDLDPVLVELATHDPLLRRSNHDALHDPRVHTTLGDAYQFVRRSDQTYDAIFIDLPSPVTYDLAKLYSREFYSFVRQQVAPGGFVALDAVSTADFERDPDGQRRMAHSNDWPVYANTLAAAGFDTVVPFLSRLTPDNPEAVQIAMQHMRGGDSSGEGRGQTDLLERATQLVWLHSLVLEQGFIFLAPEERSLQVEFQDPGVPLHALDAEGYGLAFSMPLPAADPLDASKVNSILRPLLPTAPWWIPKTGR